MRQRARSQTCYVPALRDVSVYVHFPWCLRKCPYCDFATQPTEREALDHGGYADAVLRELEARAGSLEGGRLVSVFFGGGTPSLWQPRALGRVLGGVRQAFAAESDDVEITVECNPSSLDGAHARALRDVGVNRLSVGVQSLADADLSFLGRLHDRDMALQSLREARAELPRVSADLMFGMPGQDVQGVLAHAQALVDLGLDHVSAYALTVEPATPFGARHRAGQLPLASDNTFADMFGALRAHFAEQGFSHYEVSNYARPGQISRHNAHYWRAGEYLGLGAAAVGRVGARRYRNHPDPERYMARAGGDRVEVFDEALDATDLINEAFMLGLRTAQGVDLASVSAMTGADPLAGRERAIAARQASGDLVREAGHLRVPLERWLLLDGIVADLFVAP